MRRRGSAAQATDYADVGLFALLSDNNSLTQQGVEGSRRWRERMTDMHWCKRPLRRRSSASLVLIGYGVNNRRNLHRTKRAFVCCFRSVFMAISSSGRSGGLKYVLTKRIRKNVLGTSIKPKRLLIYRSRGSNATAINVTQHHTHRLPLLLRV